AGGAYVPLDPSYPRERLAFLLADSQISVGVTLRAQRAITGLATRSLSWVCLDSDQADWWTESIEQAHSAVHPDHLASVIYPSGSTGQPKGVALAHHALVNRLLWSQQAFALTPRDRVGQVASISFDIA